ncbi:unnamed protein product [Adineta steineri]|uniref:LamG-like jellyroll fold domain-containing protein n=1 Tax=Adineta steineri TaxID=433720 RepID=A0A819PRB9_9BILA|nr:unnamed protein product [Adineta steineri]CAF4018848.1 unnamed protein product [Adineta steineri]
MRFIEATTRVGIIYNASLSNSGNISMNGTSNQCLCTMLFSSNGTILSFNYNSTSQKCTFFTNYSSTITYQMQVDPTSTFYFLQLPSSNSSSLATTTVTASTLKTTITEALSTVVTSSIATTTVTVSTMKTATTEALSTAVTSSLATTTVTASTMKTITTEALSTAVTSSIAATTVAASTIKTTTTEALSTAVTSTLAITTVTASTMKTTTAHALTTAVTSTHQTYVTTGKSTIVTSIFWAFNNDYKDVYNVYNGATTNGATFSSSVGITGYGSALSVPRTSSAYVSVFSPTLSLVNQSFTVAAWVYPTSTMYANDFPILVQCVTGADEKCFQALLRYGVPLLTFYYDDCNGVANFTANKWAHVAFVYDLSAKQQRIYVNGYLNSTHNSSGPYTGLGTSGLFIGGTTELNMYYDGLIDELSVDTRVKSASEILDIATLVLYYSFDSSTLTTDSGPNRINGTSVNAASALSGRVNSAISFQGNSSYFQANGLVLFGTSDLPYSFSLWINPGSVTNGILLFAWKNASWCLPVLGFTSAGHLYTTSKTSHNSTLLNSSSIIPTNVWTHVAHTYAPSTGIRLYINGTLSASSSAFNFSSTSSPISIALANCVNTTLCSCSTVPISMTPYNGLIDEFRFYSRALSATDVSSLANP